MKYNIFKGNVVGYKNILKKLNSQDFLKYNILEDVIIASVADGHSGDFFKYSDKGSELACESSYRVLNELISLGKEEMLEVCKRGVVQKNIQDTWMELVDNDFKKDNPVVFKTPYIRYSTTLVSIMITNEYVLCLKIGDGEAVINDRDRFRKAILTKEKRIVDSLGREEAYKNIMYKLEDYDEDKFRNIILYTDGYEDCFSSDESVYKSLGVTISRYNSSVFSRMMLIKGYESYITKLSKMKSKDDISIMFIINAR